MIQSVIRLPTRSKMGMAICGHCGRIKRSTDFNALDDFLSNHDHIYGHEMKVHLMEVKE